MDDLIAYDMLIKQNECFTDEELNKFYYLNLYIYILEFY